MSTSLSGSIPNKQNYVAIAVATNQGPFLADPDFPNVTDLGSSNPDPSTVYVATTGTTAAITGATNATPIVITTSGSTAGLAGNTVSISGVEGNLAANGQWKITVLSPTTFSLNGSVGSGLYLVDGGTPTWTTSQILVTKNNGVTWSSTIRTPPLAANTLITDIVVDPTDRDHIYVITGGTGGGQGFVSASNAEVSGAQRVFESYDAGLIWTDISTGLPDLPAFTLALDSRNGNLYLGTVSGVYELAGGVITATNIWQKFGANLPNVAVTSLDLNQSLNLLTAGTYGRGVWQFYLDSATDNTGALRAASGSDIWTGPIILTGAATISAQGNPTLDNGVSAAQLTIQGGISDQAPGAIADTLSKVGQGDVVLASSNAYEGATLVEQGNLVVDNAGALGSSGTAGQQELFLTGAVAGSTAYTLSFAGSPLAGPFTYTGGNGLADAAMITAALDGLSTINPASTVSVVPNGTAGFLITFNGALAGSTKLVQAIITSGPGTTYSTEASGTVVASGSDVKLETSLNGEPIALYGNGGESSGHFTGALENVSTNNTYSGLITLEANATIGVDNKNTVLTVASKLGSAVVNAGGSGYAVNDILDIIGGNFLTQALLLVTSVGAGGAVTGVTVLQPGAYTALPSSPASVTDPLGVGVGATFGLTFSSGITDPGGAGYQFSLTKEAAGTLLLTTANSYEGGTFVNQGVLEIENNAALGAANSTTTVLDGAELQLQGPTFTGTTSTMNNTVTGLSSVAPLSLGTTVDGPGIPTGTFITGISAGPGPYSITLNNTPTSSGAVGLVFGLQVSAENLVLSGIGGVGGTGALENLGGTNTWGSAGNTILLTAEPGFSPQTTPSAAVAIGVVNAGDTLTLGSAIGEPLAQNQGLPATPTLPMSNALSKVGAGTLVLQQNDTYSGSTLVGAGTLDIQNSGALGTYKGNAVQRITTVDPGAADTFTLGFNGGQTAPLLFGSTAAQVETALEGATLFGPNTVQVGENTIYSGVSEVQTLTVSNMLPFTSEFTLTYNGDISTPIPYKGDRFRTQPPSRPPSSRSSTRFTRGARST